MAFDLQILHAADQEAGLAAIDDAPRFSGVLNALLAEDLDNDGNPGFENTVTLSSGDAYIPGLFFGASETVFGGEGRGDILIQNELGFEAIAFGNHEFDFGTETIANLLLPADAEESFPAFPGTNFPYLSSNLDFSTDDILAPLVTPDGQEASDIPNSIAGNTIITLPSGERIGIVGATTPTLPDIASPGDVTVNPSPFSGSNPDDVAALATEIQASVDALLADNADIEAVILLSHMQQITIEEQLAELLTDVDVIIAGGSNTRLFDENDRIRDGDTSQGTYPIFQTDADGNPVAVVNTDGNYRYVGRLVISFDDDGVIIPESYDPDVSGAYATDEQGVIDLNAASLIDPEIVAITDAIEAEIIAQESNFFGITTEFLNGNRSGGGVDGVRNQETNLGNLTADANLAIAQETDPDTVISLKNGGGIRASIGEIIVPPGGIEADRFPPAEVPNVRPEGGISETAIINTLSFNNGLSLVTVTAEELLAILEHGVSESTNDVDSSQGRFPQVSGLAFSFDLEQPDGERIQSVALTDEMGEVTATIVENGEVVDLSQTFRMVTLSFLADGGDGYPIPQSDRVDLAQEDDAPRTGDATFAPDGSEQDALAEYLDDNFSDTPFNQEDVPREQDERVQNLFFREDTVLGDTQPPQPPLPENGDLLSVAGIFTSEDGEGASEINAYDPITESLFVTNGEAGQIDVLDISDPENPDLSFQIDISSFGAGVNSVAVSGGILAAAIEAEDATENGTVVFFDLDGDDGELDSDDVELLDEVEVGSLPDMVTFTPDGTTVLVANEGEPNDEYTVDPEGSVSIIDVDRSGDTPTFSVTTADFTDFNDDRDALIEDGVRIFGPGASVAQDVEPEYITVSADSSTAFVNLQENNAIAVVDIASSTVNDILPLGFKDFGLEINMLDFSDRDGEVDENGEPTGSINFRTQDNLFGMYQPDSIESYEVGGITYVVTANEGDARDYEGFTEEFRIGDEEIILDPAAFPDAEELQEDANLGRLRITNTLGDTDGDGDFDELYSYGGRSFSIWEVGSEGLDLIFDSEDDFEKLTAEFVPEIFNSQGDPDSFDERSDDKGPEPEALDIGVVDDITYAFVGLERTGGIFAFDITAPDSPQFVQYINNPGDIAPEGITFIEDDENPLLAVSNEVSGTTTLFDIDFMLTPNTPPVIVDGGIPDQSVIADLGFTLDLSLFFSDPDGDPLTFDASGLPGGLRLDSTSGIIIGAPESTGTFSITVTATDDRDASVEGDFDIVVQELVIPEIPALPDDGDDDDGDDDGDDDDDDDDDDGDDDDGDDDGDDDDDDDDDDGGVAFPAPDFNEPEQSFTADPEGGELSGTDTNDEIFGSEADDNLSGLAGNDNIFAGIGFDFIFAGIGIDITFGGQDDDIIFCGPGGDISVGDGEDDDYCDGGLGDDIVFGNQGEDTLTGNAGDDEIYGGQGSDTVSGDAGDDFIAGDLGADLLVGGAGSDSFLFVAGGGGDLLQDFEDGLDVLLLGGGLGFGDLSFVEVSGSVQVQITATVEILVTIDGITADQLTEDDFSLF